MSRYAGSPGATTSRARTSASMIAHPSSRSIADTVLLPVAMPPVSPTSKKGRREPSGTPAVIEERPGRPGARRALAGLGSARSPPSHSGPIVARLDVDHHGDIERKSRGHDVGGQ